MADENRIITYNYARTTWDQFKKQTIPSNDKGMTKDEINTFLNADQTYLNGYTNNRLVPRIKFVGVLSDYMFCSQLNNSVTAIAIQIDGKILVGGVFSEYGGVAVNNLIRLNKDGTLDSSFSTGLGFTNYVGQSVSINSICQDSDGKILVGGEFITFNGTAAKRIVRLDIGGNRDQLFVIGSGFELNGYADAAVKVNSIILQPDNKILVGGYFASYNGSLAYNMIRLHINGQVDTSFTSKWPTLASPIFVLVLYGGGKILAGGGVSETLIRFNDDGTIDYTFTKNLPSNTVTTIAVQPDGKVLIGGLFTTYGQTSSNYIARINPNGSIDPSFVVGGGFNNSVRNIYIHPQISNEILIVGDFTLYKGIDSNRLIRLNTDGSKDTNFVIGTGFNDTASSILMLPNRFYIVVGRFTRYYNSNRYSKYLQIIRRTGEYVSDCGTFSSN